MPLTMELQSIIRRTLLTPSHNEYQTSNISGSTDEWEFGRDTWEIALLKHASFCIKYNFNDFDHLSQPANKKERRLLQSLVANSSYIPLFRPNFGSLSTQLNDWWNTFMPESVGENKTHKAKALLKYSWLEYCTCLPKMPFYITENKIFEMNARIACVWAKACAECRIDTESSSYLLAAANLTPKMARRARYNYFIALPRVVNFCNKWINNFAIKEARSDGQMNELIKYGKFLVISSLSTYDAKEGISFTDYLNHVIPREFRIKMKELKS
eukprot:GHVL01036104.1.p1 GENE.GHVL01036104.1~~GHVL01036104.1.p1  ORF type:complete len:286 (+),score=33.28 GHVL01036104.1:50-859(+)